MILNSKFLIKTERCTINDGTEAVVEKYLHVSNCVISKLLSFGLENMGQFRNIIH